MDITMLKILFFFKSGKMILNRRDYIGLTTSWKLKAKVLNWSEESKLIETKVNGLIKKEISWAIVCLTEGAQQLKSMLRLRIFQTVRCSSDKPDWCIQLRAWRKHPRAKNPPGMVVRFHVNVWIWDASKHTRMRQ